MTNTSDFPLAVVANACEGAAELRNRLAVSGFGLEAIAELVQCNPLALARAAKGGATPRGMLIGLAVLTTVIDRLAGLGVGVGDLAEGGPYVDEAIDEVASQSDVAARMLMRLVELPAAGIRAQLTFDAAIRAAA